MRIRRVRPALDLGLRISLYVSGLLIGLTVSVGALVIHAQGALLRERVTEQGHAVTSLIARNVQLAVFAGDRSRLERELGAALVDDNVLEACAFDGEGRFLAGTARPGAREQPCVVPRAARVGPWEEGAARAHRTDGPGDITFWAPVLSFPAPETEEELYFPTGALAEEEALLGYVSLRWSKGVIRDGIRQIVRGSLGAGLLFLLLGGAVAHRIILATTQPLRRLAAELRLRGTPVTEPDDVGLLAGAYSGLLGALQQAFSELQTLRDHLEELVAARTAELREARDHLEDKVARRTAELEETYRQLIHAEKLTATGRLAASVSHEFNNPVFGIRNVLRSLGESPGLGVEEAALARLAIGECDRLSRLVRDLQSFSRPTGDRAEPVDLRRAVEAMVLLCGEKLRRRGIAVKLDFQEDVPPVDGVEDQLKQVVLNLLANAGDAIGDRGGTIRVSAERRGPQVVLRVADTGRGILPEHRERIFEPFFTTKLGVKGTGLGLAVSHGIVRRHGGRIEVESEPGAGAAFTVTLPIRGRTTS